jgi:hypothetical protein
MSDVAQGLKFVLIVYVNENKWFSQYMGNNREQWQHVKKENLIQMSIFQGL